MSENRDERQTDASATPAVPASSLTPGGENLTQPTTPLAAGAEATMSANNADAQPTVPLADTNVQQAAPVAPLNSSATEQPLFPAPIAPSAAAGLLPVAPVPNPLTAQSQQATPVQPSVQHAQTHSASAQTYGAPAQTSQAQQYAAQHQAAQQQAAQQQAAQQAAAQYPAGGHTAPAQYGAAFGAAAATATPPADSSAYAIAPRQTSPKKRSNAGMLVGALALVAIVGVGAGTGGVILGSKLASTTTSSTQQGPQTVTINNPDSVNAITAVSTKVLPSVVTLQVASADSSGSGSGVIVSKDGYVLTNTHVVTLGGASADVKIKVTTSDGRIYDATVVGTDPIYDLAVVKLTDAEGLTPIEYGDSSKLNVGDQTIAIGAPLGLENTVTSGIVSALNRSISIQSSAVPDSTSSDSSDQSQGSTQSPYQFDLPGQQTQSQSTGTISIAVIQTDAAINPGNSGGALVDSNGKLIGINVAIATAGGTSSGESGNIGVGFSIPVNVAERVAKEIIASGAATHGLLGASVQDAMSAEGATMQGALIAKVVDGSPAAAAGLQVGDVVTNFNGAPIENATDLTAQVRALAAGAEAKITYNRGGESHTTTVTLGTLTS